MASIPEEWTPSEVTRDMLEELVRTSNEADVILGVHPAHELPIFRCRGPYGHYVQLGDNDLEGKPKRVSIPKGVDPEDVDHAFAVRLLALPRVVGNHPETGQEISANIGRYGPYVQIGSTYASLTAADNVLTVTLKRALELIAAKDKKSRALRSLGAHPESGDPVEVFEGRYGPYVKHQRTNASLPKTVTPEDLTMEQAVELLAAREVRKPAKGGSRKKTKKA